MVVDLPGSESLDAGMAFALAGHRPVPIYNARPYPESVVEPVPSNVVLDLGPLMRGMCEAAAVLAHLDLPGNAPPAFLLDASRGRKRKPRPGWFDNRSFITNTDFPAPEVLYLHGISTIVVVPRKGVKLAPDLNDVLLTWQRQELTITFQSAWQRWRPTRRKVKRIPLWRRIRLALDRMKYPRAADGTFGRTIPPRL